VRLFVLAKLPWIRRQQAGFANQPRQSPREYVRRESHYVWGRRYLLHLIEHDAPARVEVQPNGRLNLYLRPHSSAIRREAILLAWYRRELSQQIPGLLARWEPLLGVSVADWGIKRMKTRWGSCTIEARRIWLNLELAKKPAYCLEYVLVHELTHLLERHHNERFRALLDEHLPNWRAIREELNAFVL
jgi:predicted metal-dependent hydrolase